MRWSWSWPAGATGRKYRRAAIQRRAGAAVRARRRRPAWGEPFREVDEVGTVLEPPRPVSSATFDALSGCDRLRSPSLDEVPWGTPGCPAGDRRKPESLDRTDTGASGSCLPAPPNRRELRIMASVGRLRRIDLGPLAALMQLRRLDPVGFPTPSPRCSTVSISPGISGSSPRRPTTASSPEFVGARGSNPPTRPGRW